MELYNKNHCAACGGACCKQCGCFYFTSDFPLLNKEVIQNLFSTGCVSIVSSFEPFFENDNLQIIPVLYLQSRNVGKEIVDLFPIWTECANLTNTGCTFPDELRPGSGKYLIPQENPNDCYQGANYEEEIKNWLPYQSILQELVSKYTNMPYEDILNEAILNIIYEYELASQSSDTKMSLTELFSLMGIMPIVEEMYPDLTRRALAKLTQKLARNKHK